MLKVVWFHRSRAALWLCVGVASFIFGWENSVVLVWLASLYANIVSDWGAGEAADDRRVVQRLDRIERLLMAKSKKQKAAKAGAMVRKGLSPAAARRIAGVTKKKK